MKAQTIFLEAVRKAAEKMYFFEGLFSERPAVSTQKNGEKSLAPDMKTFCQVKQSPEPRLKLEEAFFFIQSGEMKIYGDWRSAYLTRPLFFQARSESQRTRSVSILWGRAF